MFSSWRYYLYGTLLVLLSWQLAACHTDLDLNDIDPTVNVSIGFAVPIGKESIDKDSFSIDSIYTYFDTCPLNFTSLDSLLLEHNVLSINSQKFSLFFAGDNRIPAPVRCTFQLYDSLGNQIMDPTQPNMPFQLFGTDTLSFFTMDSAMSVVTPTYSTSNGLTIYSMDLTEESFQQIYHIHHILLSSQMDSISTASRVDSIQHITFIWGIAVDLDADIHIRELF